MKKITVLIIILIAVGAGAYFYNKHEAQAPINEETYQNQTPSGDTTPPATSTGVNTQTTVKGSNGPDYTPGTYSDGGETSGSDIQVIEVDFDGKTFTPATVNIHPNDYVFFKNTSTADFWPASNYPNFGDKKALAADEQYKFQFTKVGNWDFYNKLATGIHGTVVVSK